VLPSSIELLKHIDDEISFILTHTSKKNKDEVVNDPVLSRAIIRSLEIIGEACTKLDPDFKSKYPHVEWRKMAGTRNRLIHNYFGIDNEIVWDIIQAKLPQLATEIRKIIQE
jgi:uncharacterized protein with HEPN domain